MSCPDAPPTAPRFEFERFADYREPLLGKTGPLGAYLDGISEPLRMKLKRCVRVAYELVQPDGPRSFAAAA